MHNAIRSLVLVLSILFIAAGQASAQEISPMPVSGKITYEVFRGEDGMQLGQAEHQWTQNSGRYSMTLDVRTTGVIAVLYRLQYTQQSVGSLGAQGLIPDHFVVDQKGRKREESIFDWRNKTVSIRRGGEERRNKPIDPGDQDLLSTWHQIAYADPGRLPYSYTVVTAKNTKEVILEFLGNEDILLPIGKIPARRMRASAEDGSMRIEIWLARNEALLPVRVNLLTDKGEVLDLKATGLQYEMPAGQWHSFSEKY